MIKFKDLYVSLESEEPAQPAGLASGPYCWWGGWTGWPMAPPPPPQPPWDPPLCAQHVLTSVSGPICWTVANSLYCQLPVAVGGNAAVPLKEYLKSALESAVKEPKSIDDLGELEQLEQKLSGALEEIRARKAEVQQRRKPSQKKKREPK